MRMRDELGEVYADARFAGAFGVRGRPGISPGQLMMASVLQFSENLTDRQAAEAVRDRMTWKYALGLELGDPGFDASVLSEFRSRLGGGGLTGPALGALPEGLADRGRGAGVARRAGAARDLDPAVLPGGHRRPAGGAAAGEAPRRGRSPAGQSPADLPLWTSTPGTASSGIMAGPGTRSTSPGPATLP